MRVERVAYFVEAVRAGSLRAAADRLDVAQSLLSDQIRALEEELDVVLLHRSPRGVIPTAAGQRLLPHALNLLEAQRELVDAAGDQGSALTGVVRISAVPLLTPGAIAPMLAQLRQSNPGLQVSLQETSDREQLENAVRQGISDFALITTPGRQPQVGQGQDISRRVLARVPVAVCVPTGHALASSAQLSWSQLSDHGIISLRAGTTIAEIVHHNIIHPRLVAEVANLYSLTALVGQGVGLGIGVPADSLDHNNATTWLPIEGEEHGLAIQISTRLNAPLPRAAHVVRDLITPTIGQFEQLGDLWAAARRTHP
ncbi:LysR family transcriptional regulator [Mycolicibacterium palauense]|uniref:LysR family transcriptional regulator n=1 Tax=Mycolicibacterium palauense TaxID=2034511 RepID=UPI000BFEC3D5|nr:LysR family transcriptional regulator [Mycolicibacterium palauense]